MNASKGGELLVVSAGESDCRRCRRSSAHDWRAGGGIGCHEPRLPAASAAPDRVPSFDVSASTGTAICPPLAFLLLSWPPISGVLPYVDGASYRRGSLMAALAHGLPIVTTISTVSYAHFVDGETLLLVPAGDAGALATAVRRILDDPDLAQRLRTGARRLSQQFTWDYIAARSVEAYNSPMRPSQDRSS